MRRPSATWSTVPIRPSARRSGCRRREHSSRPSRNTRGYISYTRHAVSRGYSDSPSPPANGFRYRQANSSTACSDHGDSLLSRAVTCRYRLSRLPEGRSDRNFHGQPPRTCTSRCRTVFAEPCPEARRTTVPNSLSRSPYASGSPPPRRAPSPLPFPGPHSRRPKKRSGSIRR